MPQFLKCLPFDGLLTIFHIFWKIRYDKYTKKKTQKFIEGIICSLRMKIIIIKFRSGSHIRHNEGDYAYHF